MPTVSIRISKDFAKLIKKAADIQRRKVSPFIRNCIEQQLFPTAIEHKMAFSNLTKMEAAKEKLLFKAVLESLLIGRSLLSSIDDAKVQPIIDKANEITKQYYNE